MAAANRDPQLSFRVPTTTYQALSALAAPTGLSLYKFMPGWVERALSGQAEPPPPPVTDPPPYAQTIENLRVELSNQAGQVDKWKSEYETLKERLAETSRLGGNLERENKQLIQQLNDVKETNRGLESHLQRVINKAVKNSCVSRKVYETL